MKNSKKKQRQKSYNTVLAAVIATGSIVAIAPSNVSIVEAKSISFSDVFEKDHYYEAIQDLMSRGIISGFDNDAFKPGDSISRAHVAKIIALAFRARYRECDRSWI